MNRHDRRKAQSLGDNVVEFPQSIAPSGVPNYLDDAVVMHNLREHGVVIDYGDIRMMVDKRDLAKVRDRSMLLSFEARCAVVASAVENIEAKAKLLLADYKMPKEEYDALYQDLMLWQAMKDDGVTQ